MVKTFRGRICIASVVSPDFVGKLSTDKRQKQQSPQRRHPYTKALKSQLSGNKLFRRFQQTVDALFSLLRTRRIAYEYREKEKSLRKPSAPLIYVVHEFDLDKKRAVGVNTWFLLTTQHIDYKGYRWKKSNIWCWSFNSHFSELTLPYLYFCSLWFNIYFEVHQECTFRRSHDAGKVVTNSKWEGKFNVPFDGKLSVFY